MVVSGRIDTNPLGDYSSRSVMGIVGVVDPNVDGVLPRKI